MEVRREAGWMKGEGKKRFAHPGVPGLRKTMHGKKKKSLTQRRKVAKGKGESESEEREESKEWQRMKAQQRMERE